MLSLYLSLLTVCSVPPRRISGVETVSRNTEDMYDEVLLNKMLGKHSQHSQLDPQRLLVGGEKITSKGWIAKSSFKVKIST